MEDAFGIGDTLLKLRAQNKYTLDEVADGMGIARSTYYDYEQGNVIPKLDFIQKAASFYKVDPLIFFMGPKINISQQHNQVANGYVGEQHGASTELMERMFQHMEERSKKFEELYAKTIELFDRMSNR